MSVFTVFQCYIPNTLLFTWTAQALSESDGAEATSLTLLKIDTHNDAVVKLR